MHPIVDPVNPIRVNKVHLEEIQMIVLKSVREVVKALGGGQKVGDLTETSRFAVHNWVKRDQFPGHHYSVVQAAAALEGFRVPDELFARMLAHPRDLKESHDNPLPKEPSA